MDRSNLDQFYRANMGLVHSTARRIRGRIVAIGIQMDHEDVVQELSVVFIKAFDGFDESKGKFSTYFMWSAFNHFNKMASQHERSVEFSARSVEEMSTWTSDGDTMDMADLIPSGEPTPEQQVASLQAVEQALDSLSPLARSIVEVSMNPPECLEFENMASRVHAEHSRSMGIQRRSQPEVNLTFVCGIFEAAGIDRGMVARARREAVVAIEGALK